MCRITKIWLKVLIVVVFIFGMVSQMEADDKSQKEEQKNVETKEVIVAKFDDNYKSGWNASMVGDYKGECSFKLSDEQARDDSKYSGKFSYKIDDNIGGGICTIAVSHTVPGMPLKIGLWIYGEDKEEYIAVRYADSAGEEFQVPVKLASLEFKGWKCVEFELPGERFVGTGNSDGVIDYPITIRNIMPWAIKGKGAFYIDSIVTFIGE